MYDNPRDIRNRVVTLRLREIDYELVKTVAHVAGQQPAALLRDLIMEAINKRWLEIEAKSNPLEASKEMLKNATKKSKPHANISQHPNSIISHRAA